MVITPPNFLDSPILYNIVNKSLISFNTSYAIDVQWLDSNSEMWFYGIPVCGEPCSAFNDLFLAQYADESITVSPITRLDVKELGLLDQLTTKYIFIDSAIYHPLEQRIYFSLGEAEINPSGFEFLYSTDLDGNLRLETDIATLDLQSQFPTQIIQIIYNPADNNLYLVTYTDGIGSDSLIGRISLLRLIQDQGVEQLYTYDFNRVDEATNRFITSIKLSPDGQYFGIGLSSSALTGVGNLVVFDLPQSRLLIEQETLRQVCEVFWSEDSTQVIYTQTDNSACMGRFDNQPINRLVAYDVRANTSQVLFEDKETPFFFLTGE